MPTFTLKKNIFFPVLLLSFFSVKAQEKKQADVVAGKLNFTSFTSGNRQMDKTWTKLNEPYQNHPDATNRPKVSDVPGMVELFAERTEKTKYFINPSKPSEFVKEQSSDAIHYQKDGQWITIDTRLKQQSGAVIEAAQQAEPVGFDVQRKASYIKAIGGTIYFNQWSLYGEKNGVTTKLAPANWSDYTAGDDGIYVNNIFPGIDAVMFARKGAMKTNFIVNNNQFPGYSVLKFKDIFDANGTGSFSFINAGSNNPQVGDARFKVGDREILRINKGIMYTQTSPAANSAYQDVKYALSGNSMALLVDAGFINRQLAHGKVVIDPMVQTVSTLAQATITGSMNCGSRSNSCNYTLNVTPPAGATITSVQMMFQMQVNAPLGLEQARFAVGAGACLTDTIYARGSTLLAPGRVYTPDDSITAVDPTYTLPGFWAAYSPVLLPCMPAGTCPPPVIPFTLRFWNTYCGGGTGCSNTYVYSDPIGFSIRIRGNTLEAPRITRTSNVPICQGDSVRLGRTATFGVGPYRYSWLPGGETTPSITVRPMTTTRYTSIVTDSCGNSITDTTTVVVITQGNAPAVVSPQTVCQYSNIPLTAGGTNLRWWPTATGGLASFVAPVPPNVPGTYTYYVSSVTQCGETPRAQITVTVIPKPAPPTVVSPVSVCQYLPVQLTANGQNLKWYQTETGGVGQPTMIPNTNYVDSTYYYVTQTINGCESDRARIRFNVNYKPYGIVLTSKLFVCEGDTATFNYYGNALPDAVYNWSTVGGFNEIESGQGGQGPVIVRFDSAGLRQVRVQVNNRGCLSDVATQTVTVRPNPRIKYVAPESACQGETINIALSAITPLIDSFKYDFPGAEIVYGANTGGPYGIIYRNPGDYVISSMSYGRECPSRFYYDTIRVHPLPDVRFAATTTNICAGDSVLFTAAGGRDSNTQYYWTPDNFFNTGNSFQAWGVVKNMGQVKLSAISKYGCKNADSLYITARSCCEMYFPNAFSPNNDGKNDIFKPVTLGHQEIKTFRIVNRWGQVVYETKQDRNGWNGVFNGRDQDVGTYYYFIRYRCNDSNDDVEQKGELLLVR